MMGLVIAFILGSTFGSMIFFLALCLVGAFRDDLIKGAIQTSFEVISPRFPVIGDGGYFCLRVYPRPNSVHKF